MGLVNNPRHCRLSVLVTSRNIINNSLALFSFFTGLSVSNTIHLTGEKGCYIWYLPLTQRFPVLTTSRN